MGDQPRRDGNSRSPHRTPAGDDDAGDVDPVVMAAIKKAMDKAEPALAKSVTDPVVAGVAEPMRNTCIAITAELQTATNKRLDKLEAATDEIKKTQKDQGWALDGINDKLNKLLMAKSNSVPDFGSSFGPGAPAGNSGNQTARGAPQTTGLFRATDQTVIYVNTDKYRDVTKKALVQAIDVLALGANLGSDSFVVNGQEIGSKFEMRFSGHPDTARARVNQMLLSLKLGPAHYKPQKCELPGGGEVTFYFNRDKNGAQVKREILTKGLLGILAEKCTSKQFFAQRSEGIIFTDRRPLVSVQVLPDDGVRLAWKHTKRIAIGMDEAEITAAFKEICDGEPWS